jgi:hypothetical protein
MAKKRQPSRVRKVSVKPAATIKLTKLDVAAAHLGCAVRLFFKNEHSAPIFLLASAAREVIATIGEKTNTLTVQAELAAKRGISTANDSAMNGMGGMRFVSLADRKSGGLVENPGKYRGFTLAEAKRYLEQLPDRPRPSS